LQIQGLIKQQRAHLLALERARRELQELNATKDRFLSSIGRSLRDSLAEIATASASLKRLATQGPPLIGAIDRTVEVVDRSAANVLNLIENVLEWPRIQAGQKLDLLGMEVTDRDLGYLVEALDNLRFLSLAGTRVTDAGLAHVKRLKGLQELHLDGTAISDAGLALLADLQGIQILDLKDTAVTDAGLACLKSLHQLRGLYLTRTRITDAGLAHLDAFPELRTLILWNTQVTDAGLHQLHALSHLQELILWETQVSAQGAKQIKKLLPGCEVSTAMFA
jgi:signal transduction histidine kinase